MMWLWVVIIIGVIILFGLALLSFFPIGEKEITRQDEPPRVVEESEGPETTTFVEVPSAGPTVTEPEIEEMETERAAAADRDLSERVGVGDFSTASPPEGDLSEAGAVATLLEWVTTNDHYNVPDACIEVRSQGYSNRGYTIELFASNCNGRNGFLGRWRVDTLTHEVYEQKPDGRYLSP